MTRILESNPVLYFELNMSLPLALRPFDCVALIQHSLPQPGWRERINFLGWNVFRADQNDRSCWCRLTDLFFAIKKKTPETSFFTLILQHTHHASHTPHTHAYTRTHASFFTLVKCLKHFRIKKRVGETQKIVKKKFFCRSQSHLCRHRWKTMAGDGLRKRRKFTASFLWQNTHLSLSLGHSLSLSLASLYPTLKFFNIHSLSILLHPFFRFDLSLSLFLSLALSLSQFLSLSISLSHFLLANSFTTIFSLLIKVILHSLHLSFFITFIESFFPFWNRFFASNLFVFSVFLSIAFFLFRVHL